MPSAARRRFHLHLSTCIALMFVAGSMLWLNFRGVPGPDCWSVSTAWSDPADTTSTDPDGMGGCGGSSGGMSVSWMCGVSTAYGWPVAIGPGDDAAGYCWFVNLVVLVGVLALTAWLLERRFRIAPRSTTC